MAKNKIVSDDFKEFVKEYPGPLRFEIFSDGASFNNGYKDKKLPMFSSCGIVLTMEKKIIRKASKLFLDETISYAELKGASLALDLLNKRIIEPYDLYRPVEIDLYSDSEFVIKSINEWMKGWIQGCNDWRRDVWYNRSGKQVSHYKLFRKIKIDYIDNSDYHIHFFHIKGHTGNTDFHSEMNDLCDKLATQEIAKHKKELGLK